MHFLSLPWEGGAGRCRTRAGWEGNWEVNVAQAGGEDDRLVRGGKNEDMGHRYCRHLWKRPQLPLTGVHVEGEVM